MQLKTYILIILIWILQGSTGRSQSELQVDREIFGKVTSAELNEISGIMPSNVNPSLFWVHNDSGDDAKIYLIDSSASLLKTYVLENIQAYDVEDIARVRINNKSFIILADIGDNTAKRKEIQLLLFEEPKYNSVALIDTIYQKDIQIKRLKYPGKGRDAEAIFVDPVDNLFYLISKREFRSTLYSTDIFNVEREVYHLNPILSFPFTFITSADISEKGDAILMKSLTKIYYWNRKPKSTIEHALGKAYQNISYTPEPQGEAIAFEYQNSAGFFTISERPLGLESYLYFYTIKTQY